MLPNDCEVTTDACCTDLFGIADHLLGEVGDALAECDSPICGELKRYVSMGSFDDAISDALSVTFQQVALTADGTRNGTQIPGALHRATFQVSIRESGWPMASADGMTITPPDPDRQHAVARIAFSHGEKAYRHLQFLHSQRRLQPPGMRCLRASVGSLVPLRPTLGVVGFVILVDADVAWSGG